MSVVIANSYSNVENSCVEPHWHINT